ncbi:FtsW/RodA/SpoVE family cell cycle protein [Bifidobacterium jacchi]|uniref:FtsW/RodA/SpoVE family cell cycle protein n=1 Tax=Bifidobacterium jacchi TaxID=2490545 RepID=A0A5N5RKI0_9BIFI|nr:FtsW/RodA/SpoVE family cell cycle protein [Bifidobacterium jacchi]KAB5607825.1 FtsW/RodA/SpoVE family cell cycle protein [Bifidobacterium jacchi]
MIALRLRQASLLLFAMLISLMAYFQMFERIDNAFPSNYAVMLGVVGALYLVLWGVTLKFQPYASQSIMPCVLLLNAIGTVMIIRIDNQNNTAVGMRQLIWQAAALVVCIVLIVALRDYRIFRRFSYVSMVVGLVLLLSPMIPGLGTEIGGARIWIKLPIIGGTLQPGEFAKLFLAFFFAAYLFDHRDQLAVGGKKVLGMQLPRIKDLGPIIIVWIASMGVLVMQRDLGTSLMFFAMFVSMLYVATGRKSWIAIGMLAFAAGAVAASRIFAHVGYRVDVWLHPFDDAIYNRYPGGSEQLVKGLFGMAAGGMTGTGLGEGHPALTPLANSDFIYSSVGEELGLTGLMAVLVLYILIIASGFVTAMKIKDGFGKLLSSGLVFTMAFQVFTVVGGITLVIPLTGLTMPYMAAGGSSLIANYVLAALLVVISNAANKPEPETSSETFQYEALAVLRDHELKERAKQVEEQEAQQSQRRAQMEQAAQRNEQQPTEALAVHELFGMGMAAGESRARHGAHAAHGAHGAFDAYGSHAGAAEQESQGQVPTVESPMEMPLEVPQAPQGQMPQGYQSQSEPSEQLTQALAEPLPDDTSHYDDDDQLDDTSDFPGGER